MQCVRLNRDTVSCMDDVYRCFFEEFDFPPYFGANLDALYDCLTDSTETRLVVISDREYLAETLGRPFFRLCRVLDDAASETPTLSIHDLDKLSDFDSAD